jgi:hypothetical protein
MLHTSFVTESCSPTSDRDLRAWYNTVRITIAADVRQRQPRTLQFSRYISQTERFLGEYPWTRNRYDGSGRWRRSCLGNHCCVGGPDGRTCVVSRLVTSASRRDMQPKSASAAISCILGCRERTVCSAAIMRLCFCIRFSSAERTNRASESSITASPLRSLECQDREGRAAESREMGESSKVCVRDCHLLPSSGNTG